MMLFMKLARKNTKKKKKIQLISTVNRYLTYCETKTKVNDIMIKPNVGWGGGQREGEYIQDAVAAPEPVSCQVDGDSCAF